MCADHIIPSETSTHETHEPKKAVKPLKVKRGDRVRLLEDHDGFAKAGMKATVLTRGITGLSPLLRIEDKAFTDGHGANHKQWYVPVAKLRLMRKRSTSVEAKAGKSVKRAASRPTVSAI